MQKNAKMRTSVWIDARKYMLVKNDGIELSSLIDRILDVYYDLPEDPREKLVKEKIDNIVLPAPEYLH